MKSSRGTFQLGGSFIYGREDDKKRIIELLLSDDRDNHNGNFVCLVADDGTGKTTILRLVYFDESVCSRFDKRLFICMPQHFDEMLLMQLIMESVTCASCDIKNLQVLKELLKEELMRKKMLLILDNFESNNQKCWNILSMILNICTKGSAVIVTTTRETVANIRGPIQYYYLNHLSNHWCWMILKQYIFYDNGLHPNPELVEIGKDLVAKCKNNILCVKVLSGLLGYSITKEWWRVVSENDLWEMDENTDNALPMLNIAYEFLPPHLKQCFKYCSLYPRNFQFLKHHLVLMWLSQGFIEPREGRELEEIGLEYFDDLLSRSLFQHSPIHETKDRFFMPGLIHNLSQSVSISECFRFEGDLKGAPENTCHLSIVSHEFQHFSLDDVVKKTQNLKTIMVVTRSALQHENCSSHVVNLVNFANLFAKFGSLTTLNLSNTDIEELPNSIGLLKTLRYLGLSGCKIKCIPPEICNLIYLETMEAKYCHYLEELPKTIHELTNLRYLDVTKESGYIIMPSGIGRLTNLRILAPFSVGIDQSHCGIEELVNLKNLKGSLEIFGLENVTAGIDAKEADLTSKVYLETLSLNWSDIIIDTEGDEGVEISEQVLESLQPIHNLKELIIRNYPGNRFPLWMESSLFLNLESIILDNCYNCDNIPNLGDLPLLRHLSIQKMYNVQRIISHGYPSLEVLNIWEMCELEDWVEIGDGNFPFLRTLTINWCPLLRNIPCFPSLIKLSVYYCTQLPEIRGLPSLESLKIESSQKMKTIKLPQDLVGLKNLEISRCFELLSLEGLSRLTSLENINVVECPKLDLKKVHVKREPSSYSVTPSLSDTEQEGQPTSKKRMGMGEPRLLNNILTEDVKMRELMRGLTLEIQDELVEHINKTITRSLTMAVERSMDAFNSNTTDQELRKWPDPILTRQNSWSKSEQKNIHGSRLSRMFSMNLSGEATSHEDHSSSPVSDFLQIATFYPSSSSSVRRSRSDLNYSHLPSPGEDLTIFIFEFPRADLSNTGIYLFVLMFMFSVIMVNLNRIMSELSRYQL
ncbi:hypothetical protein LUZ60_008073 [Juncus effusus]|nr:hypothetical protein LUZ60_008073 [Juncus effusus]